MGGTRPADRPASAGRWGRQASTDHSHEDGEGAVDAVLFTVQDPRTARHRRVPTAHDQRQRQKTAKHETPCGPWNWRAPIYGTSRTSSADYWSSWTCRMARPSWPTTRRRTTACP